MKINKSILLAVLGLSVAGIASADEIYLTGSTAARVAAYNTLITPGDVFTAAPIITSYGGKGNGDNFMAFQGTLVGGSGTTIINCSWSGSEAGIVDVATSGGKSETFIADSLIVGQVANSDGALVGSLPPSTQTHIGDLAMADNAQAYSPSGKVLATLTVGSEVGVIPFKFVRNNGLWTGTDISDQQFRAAESSGGAKLAVFTGNSADVNSYIYVAGRDSGSGTRVNAFGDTGYGVATPAKQIEINKADGTMAVLATSHGANVYIGEFGQSSGGTLAGTLGVSTASAADLVHTGHTGYSAVAYLGFTDAVTAEAAGATELTFDGVSATLANVIEGTYTYWGNEYVYQTANLGYAGESANVNSLFTALVANVPNGADDVALIKLTEMHCTRANPASDPAHN